MKQLSDANVAVWMDIGRIAESMDEFERAKTAYEMAIKHNHDSILAKKALALLYKDKLKNNDKVRILLHHCLLIWKRPSNCFRVVSARTEIYPISGL